MITLKYHLLIFITFLCTKFCFCQVTLFESHISSTVNIDFFKNNENGSGFLYSDSLNIFLVTARHNLFELDESEKKYYLKHDYCKITYHKIVDSSYFDLSYKILNLKELNKKGLIHPSKDVDLALVRIGLINNKSVFLNDKNTIQRNGIKRALYTYKKFDLANDSTIHIGNGVFVYGFPKSVGVESIYQYDKSLPLIRSGIISTIDKKKNRYIIDATTYPGNSGGPVLQREGVIGSIHLLGLILQYLPYNPDGRFDGNSGYTLVLPNRYILTTLKEFYEKK